VLSGTVTRIDLHVESTAHGPFPRIQSLTEVASGFLVRTDPAALVVGPTGVLLSPDRRDLYVADTGNNRVQLVTGVRDTRKDRGAGETIVSGPPLFGPLGLAWTPQQTIVAANGDAVGSPDADEQNRVVEFDPADHTIVTTRQLDTTPTSGALFGIAIAPFFGKTSLFYVDDNSNTLNVLPPAH
jgi:DNA-binding beta-propeller fold protein YncE